MCVIGLPRPTGGGVLPDGTAPFLIFLDLAAENKTFCS